MVETWKVNTIFSESEPGLRRGFIFNGVLGIKNPVGSGVALTIHETYVESRVGGKLVGVGTTSVQRVTAVLGGEVVPVSKHDSGSANLPAQVVAVTNPESVTYSDMLRTQGDLPGVLATFAVLGIVKNQHTGDPWNHVLGFTRGVPGEVQKMILREGEGVTFRQDSSTVWHNQWVGMTIRVVATGETYTVFSTRAHPRGEEADMLVVFNGVGSGVVLEVALIDRSNAGRIGQSSTFLFPLGLRFMFCDDLLDGDSLTPVPFDTGNAALAGTLQFLRNPAVIVGGRAPIEIDYTSRAMEAQAAGSVVVGTPPIAFQKIGTFHGVHVDNLAFDPNVSPFGMRLEKRGQTLFNSRDENIVGLVIRPGECFAVAWGWSPSFEAGLGTPINDLWPATAAIYDLVAFFDQTALPTATGEIVHISAG